MAKFVWSLVGLLVGMWIVGVVLKVAEGAIHILLVVAGLLGIAQVLQGSKSGPATE